MVNLIALERELAKILPREFHRTLLTGALKSLREKENPLALTNFANGFRELTRHILAHRAPDREVKSCPWYVPDKTSKNGITRNHRITYLVQGGLTDDYIEKELGIDARKEKKILRDAIDELSKYTHVEEATLDVPADQADQFAGDAIAALTTVLALTSDCEKALADKLEDHISNEMFRTAIDGTIGDIDIIASHYSVDGVYIDEITVEAVDSSEIRFSVSGSIEVEHQWGSDGDARRGDAVNWSDSYPFTCKIASSVESPEELEVDKNSFEVDTSSWWDDGEDPGEKAAA